MKNALKNLAVIVSLAHASLYVAGCASAQPGDDVVAPAAADAGSPNGEDNTQPDAGGGSSTDGGGGDSGSGGDSGGGEVTATYTVGGAVSGLEGDAAVQISGALGKQTHALIAKNGSFQFAETLQAGEHFDVAIAKDPAGMRCEVTGGSGIVKLSNINSIAIACKKSTVQIGGTVVGTKAPVTISAGGKEVKLSSAGSFTFDGTFAVGSPLNIIAKSAFGQVCTVEHSVGVVPEHDVTDVTVNCTGELSRKIPIHVQSFHSRTQVGSAETGFSHASGDYQAELPIAVPFGATVEVSAHVDDKRWGCVVNNGWNSHAQVVVSADMPTVEVRCNRLF
jgi:hypothetical protein